MTEQQRDNKKLYPGWFIQRMADRTGDIRRTPADIKGQPLSEKYSPAAPGEAKPRRLAPLGRQSHYKPYKRQSSESKHAPGGLHQLSSKNIYGLTSRSEQFYPSAYKPVEDRYWDDLSDIERNELARRRIEVMRKVNYREFEGLPRNLNAAEEAYEDAQVRRHNAMRRRLSKKPRNYEERKKWEEEQRKAPLVRKYVYRELSHLEPTAFYKPGALETPVLIESQIIGESKKKPKVEDEPKVLKIRRMKRLAAKHRQETLPTANITGKPKVGIVDYVNNPFGLKSRSVTNYPEAYQSVSSVFYQQMSKEDRARIARVQAQAMEKVGFEPKTHKQFIDDFDPMEQNIYDPGTWQEPAENEAAWGDYNPYDQSISLQNRYSSQQFQNAPKPRHKTTYRLPKSFRVMVGSVLLMIALGMGFSATAPGASLPVLIGGGLLCLIGGVNLIIDPMD